MGAPRVFAGMVVTLIVFAIVTYLIAGSVLVTVLETIAAAILLQLGYFLGVGFMVWKQAKRVAAVSDDAATGGIETMREESHAPLPRAPFNRSGPFGH